MIPVDQQLELICRGTVDVLLRDELATKLRTAKPLRVKFGADPSAPDLHLGHAVALAKLRQFQDLGHTVIFLIGDFTGMIGDPTGKSETRKPLTSAQVRANAETYQQQVFKILDPERTELRFNSEWMDGMSAADVVRLCAHYTVARMLERDDFAKRYREERAIGIHEFLYPLVQGYDSVALRADVEVGGTDQRFNLLVGRELQKAYGQQSQTVVTLPLLEGTDGVQKMSKSLGNAIGIADPPDEIFGKLMSISDQMMLRYYELLTIEDVGALRAQIESGVLHPMEAKKRLARQMVARFYDEPTGRRALEGFERRFQRRELPEHLLRYTWEQPPQVQPSLPRVVMASGMASSMSEARRLIQQGAVRVDGERIDDPHFVFPLTQVQAVVQVGPRRVVAVDFHFAEKLPKRG
ncbi:MAG TPA: tyrosine--tRNA ligase [Candidatus Margulisiibacteriota bacterium]|nr:tyrosine--tRNA ligase [Candidatus Margulisiibacteriota bacterium]